MLNTLDHWSNRLTSLPTTIECPSMKILARDHEPPVFVGAGHIDISSVNEITFRMFATAPDIAHAVSCILRAKQNRYETLDQFRLFATDYDDHEWGCGWITPQFEEESGIGWLITGSLRNLATVASSSWVSKEQSVELIFHPAPEVPLTRSILTVASIEGVEVNRSWHSAQHVLEALETTITFYKAPNDNALWVTAPTSQFLTHPYAENWLGEPLRILLGQLAYPRLVARNFGNGSAQIQLRASHIPLRHSGWVSLVASLKRADDTAFWENYANLLSMIAHARDLKGHPNFESHPVTRFYEEIVQATRGSRWVQSMTLASAAEGLGKMLMSAAYGSAEFSAEEVESLRRRILGWDGGEPLKKRVLGWFSFFGNKSAQAFFRELQKQGILKDAEVESWISVRNAVMHGSMTSPWSSEEDDKQLMALASLVHSLTKQLLL